MGSISILGAAAFNATAQQSVTDTSARFVQGQYRGQPTTIGTIDSEQVSDTVSLSETALHIQARVNGETKDFWIVAVDKSASASVSRDSTNLIGVGKQTALTNTDQSQSTTVSNLSLYVIEDNGSENGQSPIGSDGSIKLDPDSQGQVFSGISAGALTIGDVTITVGADGTLGTGTSDQDVLASLKSDTTENARRRAHAITHLTKAQATALADEARALDLVVHARNAYEAGLKSSPPPKPPADDDANSDPSDVTFIAAQSTSISVTDSTSLTGVLIQA